MFWVVLHVFRLDRDAFVLHLAVVRSAVGRVHPDVRSSRFPRQWSAGHRRADHQLPGLVVRTDARVAVPNPQHHVRLRLQSDLHGVVARHRRLLPEGPQVPRPRHQHSALRVPYRSVAACQTSSNIYGLLLFIELWCKQYIISWENMFAGVVFVGDRWFDSCTKWQ